MAPLTRFLLEGHCYHTISATRSRLPIFANPVFAEVLVDSTRFVSAENKAYVLAYAIMPDHFHLLAVPRADTNISDVMHTLKGWSARKINQMAGLRGSLWQQSFYDRVIRDEQHLRETAAYIEENPVEAGLAREPAGYRFSSAWPEAKTDLEAFLLS
jgi:REP-associated tyrosine transposase